MKPQRLLPVLLAGILALPQLASAQLQLLSWWNFDTGGTNPLAIDAFAGHPAQALEGAARTAAGTGRSGGAADRAMSFGTARQRLYVADASFLNQAGNSNAISISFWQKLNAVRGQTTLFANATSMQRAISFHTPWSDSTIYFDTAGCCDAGGQRISGTPTNPVTWTGQWNHIVLIKDGDNKEVYINGVLGPSGANTGPLPTDFTELFIGNSSNLGEAVDGSLDDFAIYSGALSAAQIAQLAGGAAPSAVVGSNDTDADGLPDAWERRFFPADLTKLTAAGDFDTDGLPNPAEFAAGSDPTLTDTDGDGLKDGVETNTGTFVSLTNTGTSPSNADTDGDTFPDAIENPLLPTLGPAQPGTNPNLADTDADGYRDDLEVLYSNANPRNAASLPLRPGLLDLLAYWSFNDASNPAEVKDSIKGFAGTLLTGTDGFVSAYTDGGEGRSGAAGDRAIDFGPSGANSTGIDVEAGEVLNIAARQNQVAFSFWQKLHSVTASTSFKGLSPSSTGTERGASGHATWSDNNFYFDTAGCCDGTAQRISGANSDTNLVDEWHHFVFQKNGNAKQIWVDGVLKVSGTNNGPLPSDFRALSIGHNEGAENIAGLIDDFAIFDVLTPAQIAQLAAGASPPSLVPPSTDTDGDGMLDAYETANGLNPNVDDSAGDLDSDGLTNFTEFTRGTKPNDTDTDDDTLLDGVETGTGLWVGLNNRGTNPLSTDSDGDGFADASENPDLPFVGYNQPGTNPNLADTDGDTFVDGQEVCLGFNPKNAASKPLVDDDGDGFANEIETGFGSNPNLNTSVPALNPAALDLLAFWPFDDASCPGGTADIVHQQRAALQAGAKFTAVGGGRSAGPNDRALDLTTGGTTRTAVVRAGAFVNLGAAQDQLAVSFWQKLTTGPQSSSAFWFTSPSSSGTFRGFQGHATWSDSNYYFDTAGCCDGGTQRISGPKGDLELNEWHHFVFQKNGENKQVWVDGALTVEGVNSSTLPLDFESLYLGSANENNPTTGFIDDFAIFGDALTEEQILRLAAGEPPTALLGPAAPLAITKIVINPAAHTVQLTWNSQANASYLLEGSTSLAAGSWVEIDDNIASGGASTQYTYDVNTFPPPGTTPPRLYLRVKKN